MVESDLSLAFEGFLFVWAEHTTYIKLIYFFQVLSLTPKNA